jgi:hypothetical protein
MRLSTKKYTAVWLWPRPSDPTKRMSYRSNRTGMTPVIVADTGVAVTSIVRFWIATSLSRPSQRATAETVYVPGDTQAKLIVQWAVALLQLEKTAGPDSPCRLT